MQINYFAILERYKINLLSKIKNFHQIVQTKQENFNIFIIRNTYFLTNYNKLNY